MTWLRYVALSDVGRYLAAGWAISDDLSACHHGAHAVLMVWDRPGAPE